MSKPITPAQVAQTQGSVIPSAVFDAFNAEIATAFVGGTARVLQDRVVSRLTDGGLSRHEIFESGWLNVEESYRAAGWKVSYEKPGFNESGAACFTFDAGSVTPGPSP